MSNNTKFICYLGNISINGHSVEVRENENGTVIVRHVLHRWHTGKYKLFENVAAYESFINSFNCVSAKGLSDVLGSLGVDGFPCI
jgi:hypothetical protein